jgi:4a-hydroxytetrahydrobiopterin dehydratase
VSLCYTARADARLSSRSRPRALNDFRAKTWLYAGKTMGTKLNAESIRGWIQARKGWRRRSNKLTKEFTFKSFRDSIVFVNRVAGLADTQDHHPDIDIRFAKVTIALSTHDAGGITEKDIKMAEQIDFATSTN